MELAALRAAHAAAREGAAAAAESARAALAGAHAQEAAQLREQTEAAAEAASVRGSAIPSLSAMEPERAFQWRFTMMLMQNTVVSRVPSALSARVGALRVPGTVAMRAASCAHQGRQGFAGRPCTQRLCSLAAELLGNDDAKWLLLYGSPRQHGGCRRAQETRSARSRASAASSLRCSIALTPGAAPLGRPARLAMRCMHRGSARKPILARVWLCETARRYSRFLLVSHWPPHDPACAAPHMSVTQGALHDLAACQPTEGIHAATGHRPSRQSATIVSHSRSVRRPATQPGGGGPHSSDP